MVRGFGAVTIAPTGWTVEPVRRIPDTPAPRAFDLGPGYAARYGADATRELACVEPVAALPVRRPHLGRATTVCRSTG